MSNSPERFFIRVTEKDAQSQNVVAGFNTQNPGEMGIAVLPHLDEGYVHVLEDVDGTLKNGTTLKLDPEKRNDFWERAMIAGGQGFAENVLANEIPLFSSDSVVCGYVTSKHIQG